MLARGPSHSLEGVRLPPLVVRWNHRAESSEAGNVRLRKADDGNAALPCFTQDPVEGCEPLLDGRGVSNGRESDPSAA
jgi:hypothetical protein